MTARPPLIRTLPSPVLDEQKCNSLEPLVTKPAKPAKPLADTDGAAFVEEDADRQPFPIDCLDPISAAMVAEVSRAALVPETLAGCCALALVSTALVAGLQVASLADRKPRGNCWMRRLQRRLSLNVAIIDRVTAIRGN